MFDLLFFFVFAPAQQPEAPAGLTGDAPAHHQQEADQKEHGPEAEKREDGLVHGVGCKKQKQSNQADKKKKLSDPSG